jgi:hypothetical protein
MTEMKRIRLKAKQETAHREQHSRRASIKI